jgi:alcohol dehydrogenase class IV
MFHAPHGAVCAALLPHVMAVNVRRLRDRAPESPALQRYAEIAATLVGHPGASVEDGIRRISDLCETFGIPPLRAHGVRPGDAPALVEKAAKASSTKGNPIQLTEGDLLEILDRALVPLQPGSSERTRVPPQPENIERRSGFWILDLRRP